MTIKPLLLPLLALLAMLEGSLYSTNTCLFPCIAATPITSERDYAGKLEFKQQLHPGGNIAFKTATPLIKTDPRKQPLAVTELFVDRAFRSSGVGSCALAWMKHYAHEQGYHKIRVYPYPLDPGALPSLTFGDQHEKLCAWYVHNGFERYLANNWDAPVGNHISTFKKAFHAVMAKYGTPAK